MYEYRAELVAVVDGDTIHANVDLGFDVWEKMTLRFAGINAPEHGTPEGYAATAFVVDWFRVRPAFTITTVKDRREKYGRYLATIVGNGEVQSLNDLMVATGHAVPYSGGAR